MMLKMNATCLYTPQLLPCISAIVDSEIHIIAEDFSGHVGKESVTFDNHHGGKDYGTRNPEGLRILDLCSATDFAVSNASF